MAATIILIFAAIFVSIFSGSTGQQLRFSNGIVYNNTCGFDPQTKWSTEGSITLTSGDLIGFESKLVINVNKEVCSVDLSECPPKNLPPSPQSCYCMAKTKDEYKVHVGAIQPPTHSGMALQAVVPGRGPLKNILGVADIGVLPKSDDMPKLDATFAIDNGSPKNLSDDQTINICPDEWFNLEICVKDGDNDAELKVTSKSSITVAYGRCISIGHRFTDEETRSLTFSYKMPRCTHQKWISFKGDLRACSPTTTSVKELEGVCPTTPRLLVTHSTGPSLLLDTESFNASWIVIQRRTSGSVDFDRPWSDYEEGFGIMSSSFWLGLNEIYEMCNSEKKCELLIHMKYHGKPKNVETSPDGCYYALYEQFWLSGPSEKYKLTVTGYSGTSGDALAGNSNKDENANGQAFSTKDQDNDDYSEHNCVTLHPGGWWFRACSFSQLNGEFGVSGDSFKGIYWYNLTGGENSLEFSEMKVRHFVLDK